MHSRKQVWQRQNRSLSALTTIMLCLIGSLIGGCSDRSQLSQPEAIIVSADIGGLPCDQQIIPEPDCTAASSGPFVAVYPEQEIAPLDEIAEASHEASASVSQAIPGNSCPDILIPIPGDNWFVVERMSWFIDRRPWLGTNRVNGPTQRWYLPTAPYEYLYNESGPLPVSVKIVVV